MPILLNQEFDYSVDLLQAILWRFNVAPNLQELLTKKQAWYDENQTAFWTDWFTDVFDLRTANDFGCAVWSVILGLPLSIFQEPDYLDKPVFGFAQDDGTPSYRVNFNRGNFARRDGGDFNLTLAQKRLVLRLRYAQLITKGNVPNINAMLKYIFGDLGTCYVLDPLDMSDAVYVFEFALPSDLQQLFTLYDILPRPATLGLRIVITTSERFGFGPYHVNFNRGNFGGQNP